MLLGLIGPAQSGKTTIADTLTEHHGFAQVAFADPLRTMAYHLNPHVRTLEGDLVPYQMVLDTYGYEWAKANTNARDYLVSLGAGARMILGEDIWLNSALRRAHEHLKEGRSVVVTDVRYLNEAQAIRDVCGELWYVTRTGVEAANQEELRSINEVWRKVEGIRIIPNTGTEDDLRTQVANAIGLH